MENRKKMMEHNGYPAEHNGYPAEHNGYPGLSGVGARDTCVSKNIFPCKYKTLGF